MRKLSPSTGYFDASPTEEELATLKNIKKEIVERGIFD
jgi:hypothetical protein